MSESIPQGAVALEPAPPISSSPNTSDAGPAIGATPPEAVSESAAPAASSESDASSILSTATEAVEAAPANDAVETSAEAVTEAPKPEEAIVLESAEPPPAPVYEAFKLPEGLEANPEKIGAFTGLLSETEARIAADPAQLHAALQEFGQKLVDFHAAEASGAAERLQASYQQAQLENWKQTREGWRSEFENDPVLGKNRKDTTLNRLGGLMTMYGQTEGADRLAALRDTLTLTGVGDHIEMLRFANWAASRLTETSRVVRPMIPRMPQPANKADRLYRNSIGAA